MAYIGKEPAVGAFQKCDALTASGTADYTLQVSSTNVVPESVNHMIVSLNGVIQAPTSAFTVAGSTLSFASALTSSDSIDFVILLGNVLDIGTPSDDTVTNAKIADDAIDSEHFTDGSIDNAHIADDAIDSEHYAAGSIDTAHIADDQITLAKMASGTDGNIISYDASGNPVAIATGNDGQILTSAGAGAPPAFEAAPSGGAWTLIKTQSITSSTATMEFIHGTSDVVFDSTYRRYVCILDDLRPVTDSVLLKVHFYVGGSFLTSGYQTAAGHFHGATAGAYTGTAYASALDKCGNAADESVYGEIHFINPSSTATEPSCYSRFCTMNSTDNVPNQHVSAGGHLTAAAYTGFKFFFDSGNIANLQASLYGISTS